MCSNVQIPGPHLRDQDACDVALSRTAPLPQDLPVRPWAQGAHPDLQARAEEASNVQPGPQHHADHRAARRGHAARQHHRQQGGQARLPTAQAHLAQNMNHVQPIYQQPSPSCTRLPTAQAHLAQNMNHVQPVYLQPKLTL